MVRSEAASTASSRLAEALRDPVPMEARSAAALPSGPQWWFEPKWDGFRCLAIRERGGAVRLLAKSGKRLDRFFPEVAARIAAIDAEPFMLDGELLIDAETGPSFEALQARLHPAASRIERLSRETPARLVLFDMLLDGEDLEALPLRDRHARLARFVERFGDPDLILSPGTSKRGAAQAWLTGGGYEGVVAKDLDGSYAEGERAMIKVKRARTADCVVGGFRYATGKPVVGSLLLGLYDEDGKLNHVGFTSGFAEFDREALTTTLEALAGGAGFTGRAPGGPSRWSTARSAEWTPLKPALVVEVSFDHVSDGRFRHGTRLIRLRPDKAPAQCRMEQIA